jgi:chromosome segregation ATPase
MLESLKEVISEIKKKVVAVKEQLSQVHSENERLTDTVAVLEKRLGEKEAELSDALHKIDELTLQMSNKEVASTVPDTGFDNAAIEALVQEIDDCIIRLKNK